MKYIYVYILKVKLQDYQKSCIYKLKDDYQNKYQNDSSSQSL